MIAEKKAYLLMTVLFFVAGLGIYANVIANGIFIFDDFEYIVGNPIIENLSNLDLSDPRQIGYLTFALNFALGGDDPRGYHLFNVLVHIVNALVVFFLVRTLLRTLSGPPQEEDRREQDSVAFLAALVFLVHPLGTMAVSYISQRFTSLATLFYLMSVVGYLHARLRLEADSDSRAGLALFGASLVCTVLAMRTKEISFTIPFTVGVLEYLLFRGSVYGNRRFLFLLPFALSLAIIPLALFGPNLGLIEKGSGIAEVTRGEKIVDLTERSPFQYFFTQFRVIVIYLRLLLLPIGQCVIYDLKASQSFFEPRVLFSFGVLSSIAAASVVAWRKSSALPPARAAFPKLAALGILWFFLTLSVESSIIPIKDLMFEHRTYLPSVGFYAAMSVILVRALGAIRTTVRPVVLAGAAAAVLALALGSATVLRNQVWTDELAFWDDVVQKNPNKAIGYHNRGNAYVNRGMYERALDDVNWTIASFPKNPMAALKSYEVADFTVENRAKTYMLRAGIYLNLGKRELSEQDMKQARDLTFQRAVDTDSVRGIAKEYVRHGAYRYAIEEYSRILQWDPADFNALIGRAEVYELSGRYDEAIRDLSRIILFDPEMTSALHNRGKAYASSGRKDAAMDDFRKACGLGFQPACSSIESLQKGLRH